MNAAGRPCEIEYEVNGYSKIVFLDEDGNRTTEEIPLPRLIFIDGQFIATPVCPEWTQAPDGDYPLPMMVEEQYSCSPMVVRLW